MKPGSRTIFSTNEEKELPTSLIREFFPNDLLKALWVLCLKVDIADNNDKADILRSLLPNHFEEIGVGTNRAVFLYRGVAIKIALDRRGL